MTAEPINLDRAQALADAATPGIWKAFAAGLVSSEIGPVASIGDRLSTDTPQNADALFIAEAAIARVKELACGMSMGADAEEQIFAAIKGREL